MASPAVRTAPAFTAAANARLITLHFIDASGDLFTESLEVAIAATAANIEIWADKYSAATQMSLYKITDELIREGDADPDNADTLQRNSSHQGINLGFKNPTTLATLLERLGAPVPATMQGNQDIPLASSTELSELIIATLTLTPGYGAVSATYTERRERKNAKIKL